SNVWLHNCNMTGHLTFVKTYFERAISPCSRPMVLCVQRQAAAVCVFLGFFRLGALAYYPNPPWPRIAGCIYSSSPHRSSVLLSAPRDSLRPRSDRMAAQET